MNCTTVLEALLDAEPSELSGEGGSMVAQHVRACAQCRRLATQLRADTRLLATALPQAVSRRRVVRRTRYSVLAPVGFVAAALVMAVMRSEPSRVDVPAAIAAPPAPASVAPTVSSESPSVRATPRVARVRRAPVEALRAFPTAIPIQPVRLATGAPAAATGPAVTVSVNPPAGARAVIMHTNNPKLTVVWLH